MYGLRFGRRRDSYGPVGTCCLLIKCKRAASLSLDSPLRELLYTASLASSVPLRTPPPLALCIREPEAALVSRRNQPRPDNNEIHKSVREHGEHPRTARSRTFVLSLFLFSSSFLPLSLCLLSFPSATLYVYPRVGYLPLS